MEDSREYEEDEVSAILGKAKTVGYHGSPGKKNFIVKKPATTVKSRKNIIISRKLGDNEVDLPRSPSKSLKPKRDFEGNIVEHSLLGDAAEYDEMVNEYEKQKLSQSISNNQQEDINSSFISQDRNDFLDSISVGTGSTHNSIPLRVSETTKDDALQTYRKRVQETASLQRNISAAHGAKRETSQTKDKVLKHVLIHERISLQRETHAIARWGEMQSAWASFKKRMVKKLGTSQSNLVISQSEDYREMIEEYDLIQKATPLHLKHGSHYWLMSLRGQGTRFVPVGNIFSGLFCPVRDDPNPIAELIRRPNISLGKDSWRNNVALAKRKVEYKKAINHLKPYQVTADKSSLLVIKGSNLLDWCRDSTEQFYIDRNISKGIVANFDKNDANSPSSSSPLPPLNDFSPEKLADSYNQLQLQHANSLGEILDTVSFQTNAPLRVLFESNVGQDAFENVELLNNGNVVIFYEWRTESASSSRLEVGRLRKQTPWMTNQKYFFCPDMVGSVLPGEKKVFQFTFFSSKAGIFREKWTLLTTPSLASNNLSIFFKGISLALEENSVKRNNLENMLEERAKVSCIQELIHSVIDRVKTPEPVLTDAQIFKRDMELFESSNTGLFYTPLVYNTLKGIAKHLFDILGFDEEDAVWNNSIDSLLELIEFLKPSPERDVKDTDAELAEKLSRQIIDLANTSRERPMNRSLYYPIAEQLLLNLVYTIPEHADRIKIESEQRAAVLAAEAQEAALKAQLAKSNEKPVKAVDKKGAAKVEPIVAPVEEIVSSEVAEVPINYLHHKVFDLLSDMILEFVYLSIKAEATLKFQALQDRNLILSNKAKYTDIDVRGKTIIYRTDLDVSIIRNSETNISEVDLTNENNEKKITSAVTNMKELIERGVKIIVCISHFGDKNSYPDGLPSLEPLIDHLSRGLNVPVKFVPVSIGLEVEEEISNANFSSDLTTVILLENIRCNEEELSLHQRELDYIGYLNFQSNNKDSTESSEQEKLDKSIEEAKYHNYSDMNDDEKNFCDTISSYGDFFINDCLSECITKASSIIGVNPPGGRVAGPLLSKYLDQASKILENPKGPIRAILSGEPTAELLQLFKGLVSIVDEVLLGGEIANLMSICLSNKPVNELHANPFTYELKSSFLAINKISLCRNCKITLPIDFMVGDHKPEDENYEGEMEFVNLVDGIPISWFVLDIGTKTIDLYKNKIENTKTLLWFGTLGECEKGFQDGTKSILDVVRKNTDITSYVLEKNTQENIDKILILDGEEIQTQQLSYSNAAFIQLLSGLPIPGVTTLTNKNELINL